MNALTPPDVTIPPAQPVQPVTEPRRRDPDRVRAFAWSVLAVASIWVSVALISIFSPDLISGTEQEHVPLAAILTWIFGAAATKSVIAAVGKPGAWRAETVRATALLALSVAAVWFAATIASVFSPVMVTGTDPTHLPLAALIAPIAAMVITQLVCQLYTAFGRPSE